MFQLAEQYTLASRILEERMPGDIKRITLWQYWQCGRFALAMVVSMISIVACSSH
jgi:hypothetical protein